MSRSTPEPASPSYFYINYHLYRLVFPLMALGGAAGEHHRFLGGRGRAGAQPAGGNGSIGQRELSVASHLLGRRQRAQLLAIYGFARLVDDIGDEAPGDRSALLDWLEQELDLIYRGGLPDHPVMRALAAHDRRHSSCPTRPFRRLIEANRRDQVVDRYDTFDNCLATASCRRRR